jgi:hypothetical protein
MRRNAWRSASSVDGAPRMVFWDEMHIPDADRETTDKPGHKKGDADGLHCLRPCDILGATSPTSSSLRAEGSAL